MMRCDDVGLSFELGILFWGLHVRSQCDDYLFVLPYICSKAVRISAGPASLRSRLTFCIIFHLFFALRDPPHLVLQRSAKIVKERLRHEGVKVREADRLPRRGERGPHGIADSIVPTLDSVDFTFRIEFLSKESQPKTLFFGGT